MKRIRVFLYALLMVCPALVAAAPSISLPGDSLYQLPLALQDQQGRQFDLASMRGRPVIVSMFYTACSAACPLTVDTIDQIRHALNVPDRAEPSVLLVSMDPEHDDVVNLAAMAKAHQLDPAHWRLTRTTAGDTMAFAATLGVAYRRRTDADFSHNAVIALLDENGRIVARTSVIGKVDPAFVSAVRERVARY
ncbi:SCO family protein [Paraburkholderia adhaesiva]|uniref:SCO family protein n=1 Tax=Paraburkholderia adhaesiva TaxID=2883244 RepID=UPI001F46C31E|nr:SCO family protein [Paraburkholderia adhaesiva]